MTRLTKPGKTDLQFMTATCTPSDTAVEFFETRIEASAAARVNLAAPGTSAYVCEVWFQGEHRTRSSSSQVAIVVPVDAELRAILRARYGVANRADLVACITRLVQCTMATLRSEGAIPPALGETYMPVQRQQDRALGEAIAATYAPDPAAHPGQSSDDEHTQPGETMACGCALGLHAPRKNYMWAGGEPPPNDEACALGWPLSWRTR